MERHQVGLCSGRTKENAGGEHGRELAVVAVKPSSSFSHPPSRSNSKPAPLQRQVWKERQHSNPIPANGPTNKRPGNQQVATHSPISQQPSNPPPLSVEQPERERPNTAKRVVGGDREDASKARRWIMRRGERKRQQSPSKRRPAGHNQDQDAASKRERPQERVDPDPSPTSLARERRTRYGRYASQLCGSHWETAQELPTEETCTSVT